MEKLFAGVLLGIFITLVFWSDRESHGNEYNLGKDLYEGKCRICHGANGKGDGPAAAALSPSPANFTDPQFWRNNAVKKIEDTIHTGKGSMPPFRLDKDEIKAVIDYMSHAFKKE
jgi:mono/diheme cytochrome c family protein